MLHKLCLGTVQFGLDYGINNPKGKPSFQEICSILDTAIEAGIQFFDTASAYGDAEKVLGEYGISKKPVKIISKLAPQVLAENTSNTEDVMERQILQSLNNMKIDRLDGYLLHSAQDFDRPNVINGLLRLKERKLVSHVGVSIYDPEDAIKIVKSGVIDYIQIPYNIFDQRLDQTDFFQLAQKHQVQVFARSAFLQGLLLMNQNKVANQLKEAIPHLDRLDCILGKYGYTRQEAAFLFSYTHPYIHYCVFGVDRIDQLQEEIQIISRADISCFSACRKELSEHFKDVNQRIISPNLWGKIN